MTDWSKVKWTDARQIAEAMDLDESALPSNGQKPREHFLKLRESGDIDQAALYIGQALPRFEAVAWATHVLEESARRRSLSARDRQALDRSLRWVEDPSDEYRRAAYEAAQTAGGKSPERLLGLAIFVSGGSIAPPELPAVNPPQDVCGKIAAAAVIAATADGEDRKAALESALDLGDKVASKGVQALASP